MIRKSVTEARYFPVTIFHIGTGHVLSNTSVPFFFSSDRSFIVIIGTINVRNTPMELSVWENSAEAFRILLIQNIRPTIAMKNPIMQYATGERK